MKKVLLTMLLPLLLLPPLRGQASCEVKVSPILFPDAVVALPPEVLFPSLPDSSVYIIDSIRVDGYASPTGTEAQNTNLAAMRARNVADTLGRMFPGVPVTWEGHGAQWEPLGPWAAAHLSASDAEAVSRILAGPASERKSKLMSLRGGNPWRTMAAELYPSLRRADVTFYVSPRPQPEPTPVEPEVQPAVEPPVVPAPIVEPVPVEESPSVPLHRIIVAPRSNALVPLMNVGVCVPLSRRLSVDADFYSPWLGYDKANSRCFQVQAADIEFRYWLNPRSLDGYTGNTMTGHSLAVGAFGGHADFERDWEGIQVEGYGGYLQYMYTFYLASHLRLSLSLAGGVVFLPWRDYRVWEEGGKLIRSRPVLEHRETWMGPLKAEVSLWVPITLTTKTKEGGR